MCDAVRAALEATGDALSVLVGGGLDLENRMERYYRDARVMTIPDGTPRSRSSSSARGYPG